MANKIKKIKLKYLLGLSPNSENRIFDKNYKWDGLYESIKKDGYDTINYKPISVVKFFNNYYLVSDGHHRTIILKELYGEDYEIDAEVINFFNFFFCILFIPILLTSLFLYRFIHILFKDYFSKLFKNKK
jgi:hypothetical protein